MRLYKFLFIIYSILISSYSLACLNDTQKELFTGTILFADYDDVVPNGHHFFTDNLTDDLVKLDSLYTIQPKIDYLIEKGIIYIIQGKFQKAIDLYLDIEKQKPNQYSTASNLGTAYELIGDNKNALKWITKALELNPNSHEKSEWIHVNILRIKLGELSLSSKNLINQDFGNEDSPKTSLSTAEIKELINYIYYQLNERMSFVKPKNGIVAQLLFDYGNSLYLIKDFKNAKIAYDKAVEYGNTSSLLQKRLDLVKKNQQEKSNKTGDSKKSITFFKEHWDTILISILAVVIFFFVFKNKQRKTRR